MVRQWNSESEDWVTILSTISWSGWLRIQSVMSSPRSSRSFALVAENTFTPVTSISRPSSTEALDKRATAPSVYRNAARSLAMLVFTLWSEQPFQSIGTIPIMVNNGVVQTAKLAPSRRRTNFTAALGEAAARRRETTHESREGRTDCVQPSSALIVSAPRMEKLCVDHSLSNTAPF